MSGRGGARPNSGPSRQVGSVRWRREQRRLRRRVPPAAAAPVVEVGMPADLPAGQAAIWQELAPHALAAGTLTRATVRAFRDLCEAIVLKRDMLAIIQAEGLTTTSLQTKMDASGGGEQVFESKAHCLLSRHAVLMVRVETGLARFGLNPMGKPKAPREEAPDEFMEFESSGLRAVK